MALALQPTVQDSRTNATFEEMMFAMSRPGVVRILPGEGLAIVAEAILDNECTFAVQDDTALEASLLRSGARAVSFVDAEYVFTMLDTPERASTVSKLRVGTLTYPDEGATLFVPARIGSGRGIRLTGPGIRDNVTIALDGVDPSFWGLRDQAIRYPLGYDIFFIDGSHVVGLPRSTRIEVL